jgi:DNA-binding XRE family transcriptional regulator
MEIKGRKAHTPSGATAYWRLSWFEAAEKEARRILDEQQYSHVVEQFDLLAMIRSGDSAPAKGIAMKRDALEPTMTGKVEFLPHQASQEQLALALLIDRLAHLPAEAIADLAALAPELAHCKDRDEFEQIAETIKEVLFPEIAGELRELVPSKSEKLESRKRLFAIRLKSLRAAANMTQEQLAEKADLPQSHISRLEKGLHSPSHKTIERIASALAIDVESLELRQE